jgi:hypothetical protein
MAEADENATPRLLALLAEAARHPALREGPRAGTAGFMLGAAVGLVLGLTEPTWSEAALDELAELLAADDGRSRSAHRAELWGMARRLVDEAAAIEREELP